MATPSSRPSLTRLDSGKLKRSDSQKIQTTFFPKRLTVELRNVTEKLRELKNYIGRRSNDDNDATYSANTKRFLSDYSRLAKAFLATVLAEDSNSYERFCLSIYMSLFHSADYEGMLKGKLPPTYDILDTNRLFLPVANLDNVRKKIGLRVEIDKLVASYAKMEQIMDLKVQAWAVEVVERETRVVMPPSAMPSLIGSKNVIAFQEAVYESVGV